MDRFLRLVALTITVTCLTLTIAITLIYYLWLTRPLIFRWISSDHDCDCYQDPGLNRDRALLSCRADDEFAISTQHCRHHQQLTITVTEGRRIHCR